MRWLCHLVVYVNLLLLWCSCEFLCCMNQLSLQVGGRSLLLWRCGGVLWRFSPFYPLYRIGIGFLGTLCNLLLLFCHPQLALVDLRSVSGGITLLIGFVKILLFISWLVYSRSSTTFYPLFVGRGVSPHTSTYTPLSLLVRAQSLPSPPTCTTLVLYPYLLVVCLQKTTTFTYSLPLVDRALSLSVFIYNLQFVWSER